MHFYLVSIEFWNNSSHIDCSTFSAIVKLKSKPKCFRHKFCKAMLFLIKLTMWCPK